MSYTYWRSEPGLWTVGEIDSQNGKHHPESDHESEGKAAARVHYLNGGTDDSLTQELANLRAQVATLTGALEAVVLFYSTGEWGSTRRRKWFNLTQNTEATTKVLCDVARAALQEEGKG